MRCATGRVTRSGDDFVTLSLHDRAGTMGFPGTMDVQLHLSR